MRIGGAGMELRQLGRTDVKVSAMALGVMTFGAQTDEADAFAQLDMSFDAGINLFDTAENYPAPTIAETQGRSEEILGKWAAARKRRGKIVIATKVTGPNGFEHVRGEKRRLDKRNIAEAIEGSLRRLNTDYIDLYQVHWPDRPITTMARPRFIHIPDASEIVPIEDTFEVLAALVKAGKVRHIGVANETPWGAMRYLGLSKRNMEPRIVSVQNSYSLLNRSFEIGLAEVAMREQVGLLAYSPLASGLLTGKYLSAACAAAGGRASVFPGFERNLVDQRKRAAVEAYVDIARRYGLNPAGMALAFVRQRPFVTAVLAAASTTSQLEENLKSLDITLARDILKEIDAVHDAQPNPN
jgi:aryl-alcohol dehydrogenase-like predicted oxidoreductase